MGGFLLIGGVILMGGLLWSAVSCIQGGATARYEAASLARAVEVKDAAHATEVRLREEGAQAVEAAREDAQAEIAAIRAREAEARAERDRHAARANDAEATANRALALVDEMEGQACPPPPKPEDPCSWLCTMPPRE